VFAYSPWPCQVEPVTLTNVSYQTAHDRRRTMASTLLAATVTLTRGMAVVIAAAIAGVASLSAALTAGIIASRNEKSRQRHASELKKLELDDARIAGKHALLREAAAAFAITAIELAEQASAVTRDPTKSIAVDSLRAANGKLRTQYETLLLLYLFRSPL
jgi:hypothetical protein